MSYQPTRSTSSNSDGRFIVGPFQHKTGRSISKARDQGRCFAATLIRSNICLSEIQNPLHTEDAYVASVSLNADPDKSTDDTILTPQAGMVTITDLGQANRMSTDCGANIVHFYFAKSGLDALSKEQGGSRIDLLQERVGISTLDPTMHSLASALLPALETPNESSRIFLNHLMRAAGAHILKQYAGFHGSAKSHRGGLACWQQKRATELLLDHLSGDLSLSEIALKCRLSTRHFTRAFAQSMGITPHQWLLRKRAEKSMELMRLTTLTLNEIAESSGFTDQSHFTRAFSLSQGISPGAWRRLHATARPARVA